MSDRQQATTTSHSDAVLRRLAVAAAGCTGADIQKLVKEARQQARRAKRPLAFADLEGAIRRGRTALSQEVRWRVSVHEAGHAIAWSVTRAGRVQRVSTGQVSGGQTEVLVDDSRVEDEPLFSDFLCCILAGRAAEWVIFGDVIAGSGGGAESDLAKATMQAIKMETEFGMSKDTPLLYIPSVHPGQDLRVDPGLAKKVNRRLESAYDRAKLMMEAQRPALLVLAKELHIRTVLEAAEIDAIVAGHLVSPTPS